MSARHGHLIIRDRRHAAIGPISEPMTNALHVLPQSAGLDWQAADSLDLPVPPVVDHKNPIPVRVLANAELCNTAKVLDTWRMHPGSQAGCPRCRFRNQFTAGPRLNITVSSYGNIHIHKRVLFFC
jgi:hypothetical protein